MPLFDEEFLRKLEALRLAVRRSISGRREGERATRKRGGSSDFVAHRGYAQGDEFRAIDWNLYGRLGQLYVKEFAREEALPAALAVDTTRSMEPKFDFARRLGAVLALVATERAVGAAVAAEVRDREERLARVGDRAALAGVAQVARERAQRSQRLAVRLERRDRGVAVDRLPTVQDTVGSVGVESLAAHGPLARPVRRSPDRAIRRA